MTLVPFPRDFLWGVVCTDLSGAPDAGHRLDAQLALLERLGVHLCRLTLSWADLQPAGRGPLADAPLARWRQVLDRLAALRIVPLLTLHDGRLPDWVRQEGGWAVRRTAQAFAAYADQVFAALGQRHTHWLTLDDPARIAFGPRMQGAGRPALATPAGMAPAPARLEPAIAAAHHLLLGHGLAVQALRRRGIGGRIGLSLRGTWHEPYSSDPADLAAAARGMDWPLGWFLGPLHGAHYPEDAAQALARQAVAPPMAAGDLDTVATPMDFLGVSYFDGGHTRAPSAPPALTPTANLDDQLDALRTLQAVDVTGLPRTASGDRVYPEGLYKLLVWLRAQAPRLPVIVTANGTCTAATADPADPAEAARDGFRLDHLYHHVIALNRAMRSGCDLRGYCAWTLLDEPPATPGAGPWATGLAGCGADGRPQPRQSFDWYRGLVERNGCAL